MLTGAPLVAHAAAVPVVVAVVAGTAAFPVVGWPATGTSGAPAPAIGAPALPDAGAAGALPAGAAPGCVPVVAGRALRRAEIEDSSSVTGPPPLPAWISASDARV